MAIKIGIEFAKGFYQLGKKIYEVTNKTGWKNFIKLAGDDASKIKKVDASKVSGPQQEIAAHRGQILAKPKKFKQGTKSRTELNTEVQQTIAKHPELQGQAVKKVTTSPDKWTSGRRPSRVVGSQWTRGRRPSRAKPESKPTPEETITSKIKSGSKAKAAPEKSYWENVTPELSKKLWSSDSFMIRELKEKGLDLTTKKGKKTFKQLSEKKWGRKAQDEIRHALNIEIRKLKGIDKYDHPYEKVDKSYRKRKTGGRIKSVPLITGPKASKRRPTTKEKREFIYSPAAKDFRRGRPTSKKSKKAIKKSVEALPKVKQRKKKIGGKIQYRSIGGKVLDGNDITKMIYD